MTLSESSVLKKSSERASLRIEISNRSDSLIMDESSQHKKQKLSDQGGDSKAFEIASKLIESGDSTQLREQLANGELSEVNMENALGKRLLVIASESEQLCCLRVLLDHLESSSTKLVDEQIDSDYQSCGVAYLTRGKHRFLKIDLFYEIESDSDSEYESYDGSVDGNEEQSVVLPTKSLVLVACHRRYHHLAARYYKDYEIAEIEPGAVMSKYIYVDISNLFIEACKMSDIEQVEYLISMGADVNRVDYHGRNAAVLACVTGNLKLMEVLLKHGANPNTRVKCIERDAKHDVDHDADARAMKSPEFCKDEIWYEDYDDEHYDGYIICAGDSLLHLACPGDPAMMKLLLEHGADVFALDGDFHHAAFMHTYESGSTSTDAMDVILDYAFRKPFSEIESYGQYPLHIACANVDYPLIERMLQKGADVNAVDGDTPLHRVLHTAYRMKGSKHEPPDLTRCVKLLLDYGADVTIRDSEGKSVFEYVEPGSELDALLREDRKPVLK